MRDLYIIGAGGFGREVAWLVERINAVEATWELKGFIDDNELLHDTSMDGYPVVGGIDYLNNAKNAWAVCAVGNATIRKNIISRIAPQIKYATLIDPSVIRSERIDIGEGSIICAGTIVTVDVTIGKHVIVNLDCTIGHDATLGDYNTLYPSVNVSGGTNFGECVELGTGAQIIQGLSIATGTIAGAGAVVVKDIEEAGTYVGVPAVKV